MPENESPDFFLLRNAAFYDLNDPLERCRSAEDLAALFYQIQEHIKPDFTIEVGAFGADFSIEMRKRGIRAIAFEANPYNYNRMQGRPEMAPGGVEYLNMAISDNEGVVDFHIQSLIKGQAVDPVRGNNSILKRNETGVEYEVASVPCSSLRNFFKTNALSPLRFSAWIDVEGAIANVIEGAGSVFANCCSLMVEVEEKQYWSEQKLAPEVIDYFFRQNFVPVARDFEYESQYNLVFIAKSLLTRAEIQTELISYYSRIGQQRARLGMGKKQSRGISFQRDGLPPPVALPAADRSQAKSVQWVMVILTKLRDRLRKRTNGLRRPK